MAFSHGKDAVFKLDNGAGTLTDVSVYLDSASLPRSADSHETTTFGKASKTFLAGLKGATFALSGLWDPALDVILDADLGATATKSFEYGPAGSTAGAVKYSGESIITSYQVESPVDGPATFSAEGQITDNVTRTVWP